MKIKSLNAENHPTLGTFLYNFEEDSLITLLVGKNGSGKTRLIEELYKLLNSGFRLWSDKSYGDNKTKIELNLLLSKNDCVFLNITTGNLTFKLDYSDIEAKNQWQTIRVINTDDGADLTNILLPKLQLEPAKDGFYKLLQQKIRYSSVLINFEYKPVTAFAEKVDDEEKIQTKSTTDVADEINKLLVATYYKDGADARKKFESGELKSGEEKYSGDFDRFVDAYNKLFTNKEISGVEVEDGDNKIRILNKDTGETFGIEGLSSGEQQVVYRVGYLLKNLNIKNGGIVFIDEPELSLHPEWQVGYIPFLQSIFGDDVQFVLATHSPYVVKSGIDSNDVAITKLYSDGNDLKSENLHHTSKLGRATFAEVNYKAFGIVSEEFHTELYLSMQRTYSPEHWDSVRKPSPWYVGGTPTSLDRVISTKAGITKFPSWKDVNSGKEYIETIMTFIRNIIHHGDEAINRGRNRKYTEPELKQSIEEMLKLL
jgi:predicted ATP-dependent endonuclease of OLD family